MALRSAAEPLGLCEEDSSRGGALPAEEEVSNESRQVVICQQSLVKCQLSLSKLDIRRVRIFTSAMKATSYVKVTGIGATELAPVRAVPAQGARKAARMDEIVVSQLVVGE